MPINIQDYLLGRIPVGRKIDIPAYLMAKAASGGRIQEITGTLPLTVRSRASQVLKNYIIYGTSEGVGVETENLWNPDSKTTNQFGTEQWGVELPAGTYTIKNDSASTIYQRNGKNSTWAYTWALPGETSTHTFDKECIAWVGSKESNVMLTEGSTAPTSYIPYGYKLPLKVTADGTTTDYPVYIGDSQLGEEEYVDYESGKVWKRTEQLITFGEKEFALNPKHVIWSTFGNAVHIVTDGTNPAISGTLTAYKNNLRFTLSAGTYSYRLIRSESGHTLRIRYVSDNTIVQDTTSGTFTIAEETDFYFSIYINAGVVLDTVDYMVIVEGEEIPATIVPYLQPTDPPVPLPDITIPKGEVTIDIDGDIKPQATIKGKIEQI